MSKRGWVAAVIAGVLTVALTVVVIATWDGGTALRPVLAVAALGAILAATLPVMTRRAVRAELHRARAAALRDAAVRRLHRQ